MYGSVPVVDGGSSQHHRIVVGPFGCVAPTLLVAVPEMATCGVTYDPLWKTLPHSEGKVHLNRGQRQIRVGKLSNSKISLRKLS